MLPTTYSPIQNYSTVQQYPITHISNYTQIPAYPNFPKQPVIQKRITSELLKHRPFMTVSQHHNTHLQKYLVRRENYLHRLEQPKHIENLVIYS